MGYVVCVDRSARRRPRPPLRRLRPHEARKRGHRRRARRRASEEPARARRRTSLARRAASATTARGGSTTGWASFPYETFMVAALERSRAASRTVRPARVVRRRRTCRLTTRSGVERAMTQFLPRIGRTEWTEVSRGEQRLGHRRTTSSATATAARNAASAAELSERMGRPVIALALEEGAVVRYLALRARPHGRRVPLRPVVLRRAEQGGRALALGERDACGPADRCGARAGARGRAHGFVTVGASARPRARSSRSPACSGSRPGSTR